MKPTVEDAKGFRENMSKVREESLRKVSRAERRVFRRLLADGDSRLDRFAVGQDVIVKDDEFTGAAVYVDTTGRYARVLIGGEGPPSLHVTMDKNLTALS